MPIIRRWSKASRALVGALSALAIATTACGGGAGEAETELAPISDPEVADRLEELAAAAKEEEGQLDWYYILGEEAIRPLIDAFTKRYPFVDVNVTGAGGLNLIEKILSENRTGNPIADVIQGGPLEDSIICGESQLCFDYRPIGEDKLPESIVFNEKNFVVPSYFTFHIVYNTNLVSEDEAPTSLADLTKPKWRGKFGVDAEQIDWFAGQIAYYGEERGLEIMRALAENDPVVFTGTQGYEQMAAGALPVAINMYSILLPEYINAGAPMAIADTDHVIAQPDEFVGISSTNSPNTLKLFLEWLFTKEAQAIFPESLGKTPMVPDVPVPELFKNACTDDCELFFETSENFGNFEERVSQFQDLFVSQQN